MAMSLNGCTSQFSLATWTPRTPPEPSALLATADQDAAAWPVLAAARAPAGPSRSETQPLLPQQTSASPLVAAPYCGTAQAAQPTLSGTSVAHNHSTPALDAVSDRGVCHPSNCDVEAAASMHRSRSAGSGSPLAERFPEDKRVRAARTEVGAANASHGLEHPHVLRKAGISGWLVRSEGILLSALAQALYACIAFFFKLINNREGAEKVGADQAVLVRMTITWLCCTVHLLWRGDPHPLLGPPNVRGLLVLRGFAGFFGVWGMYSALQYLDLTDATVITFLSPITTAIGGAIFLGERLVVMEYLAAFASLVGVVLIARPPFLFGPEHPSSAGSTSAIVALAAAPALTTTQPTWPTSPVRTLSAFDFEIRAKATEATDQQRVLATCTLLMGVLGSSTAYIAIRKIGRRASASHSVTYFSMWSAIVSGACMCAKGERFVVPNVGWAAAVLVLIGFFGFYGQFFAALGLQRTEAGKAAAASYLQIVFATFFQLVFLHVPIAPLSIWGAVIIIASALWVTLLK